MPEYTNFQDFSRDLFVFSIIPSNRRKSYDPTPLMIEATDVLDYFSIGHQKHFRRGFIRNQYIDLETDEDFYRFAIAKCLQLVDSERYFYSLMLIACYLRELLNFLKNTRLCYRFHFTAYKCYLAVFKREFESEFDENKGMKGLREYFEVVRARVAMENNSDLFTVINNYERLCEKALKLIEDCNVHTVKDFVLNEHECLLFIDDDNKAAVEEFTDDESDDPIDLKWPLSKDDVDRKISACFNRDGASGTAVGEVQESDLGTYVKLLVTEGARKANLSLEEYCDLMMKSRKCPCCGVRCQMLFRNLFRKHLDLALHKTSHRDNVLAESISRFFGIFDDIF